MTVRTVALALLCLAATACAQVDTTRATVREEGTAFLRDTTLRRARATMDRAVSTFLWDLNADASGAAGATQYTAALRYLRTFIPEEGSNAERTDAIGRLAIGHPIVDDVRAFLAADARNTVDNRSIGLGEVRRMGALAGLTVRPTADATVSAAGGEIVDRQIGIQDAGPQYLVTADVRPTTIGDYDVAGHARSGIEFLGARRNTTHGIDASAVLRTGTAEVRAHAETSSQERDFYFVDTSLTPFTGRSYNIEARTENDVHGGLLMTYDGGGGTRIVLDGDAGNRAVTRHDVDKNALVSASDIDTRAAEFRLTVGATMMTTIAGVAATAGMRYERFEETHAVIPSPENSPGALQLQTSLENQKNAIARRTMLTGGLAIPTGGRDSAVLSGSFGVLHYDTPDTLNNDDRDELDAAIHGAWGTDVNAWCAAGIRADLFLHHLVYLIATQSGTNAWNRIVRLAPYVQFTPVADITSIAVFEVLGNYTVYDFEGLVASVHSYAFRRMALRDSLAWRPDRNTWITGAAEFRWYEHGQLAWTSFSERPVDRVREWAFGGAAGTRVADDLDAEAGVQGFLRRTDAYAGGGAYVLASTLTTLGPTGRLRWSPRPGTGVSATGWYQIVRDGTAPTRVIPNLNLQVTWGM